MPGKYDVIIEPPVLDYLRGIADERNRIGRANGCKHRPGINDDSAMRKGTLGEYAYCVWAGIDFREHAMLPRPWEDDDINGVQIRTSGRSWGHLLTHDYDPPGQYVLVTLNYVKHNTIQATLRGWQWLHECNTPDRWNTRLPYPAYATAQSALHPMSTLTIIYN